MPEPLIASLAALFIIWPLLGHIAFKLFNRARRNAGKQGEIGDTEEPTEVLARMYLWPLVLYKYLKSAKQHDHP